MNNSEKIKSNVGKIRAYVFTLVLLVTGVLTMLVLLWSSNYVNDGGLWFGVWLSAIGTGFVVSEFDSKINALRKENEKLSKSYQEPLEMNIYGLDD